MSTEDGLVLVPFSRHPRFDLLVASPARAHLDLVLWMAGR